MFYAHLLLNKRGPLAKIWLAAHWEKKLTKAHVYECNLETTIQSIISPKVTIALRTSGHLLLGVVRIYHRKAKYLLADCNEAFMKMKMAFRPGTVDLSEDNQEATYNAITLPEEFHEFDIHLPDLNTIDVVDHFSLNQSRVEDITLREEFGRNLILHGDFGDDLETVRRENPYDGSLEMNTEQTSTALPEEERQVFTLDCFGDEGLAVDMFEDKLIIDDTLSINEDNVNMSKEMFLPPEASSEGLESAVQEEAVASHPAGDESTLLYDEEEGFVLEPVEITAAVEKKRHKRRRNLLVDSEKELSSDCLRQQLIDFTDTLTTVDIAPPTHKLMNWKSKGGVDWLLSNPAEPIISAELLVVFTHCLVFHTQELGIIQQVIPEIETIRHQQEAFDLPMIEDPSFLQESRLTDAGSSLADDPMQIHSQTLTDKPLQAIADLSGAPAPQTKSPCTGENPASGVSTQDNEEQRCSQRIQEVLNSLRTLNLSGLCAFSLLKLCNNKNRRQASAMFYSFLVLKKHSAINLSQPRPYCDIMATPGPTFHSM